MDTSEFLVNSEARKGRWREADRTFGGFAPRTYWTGSGQQPLEVALGTSGARPTVASVRDVWLGRQGRSAAPLLLVVAYSESGSDRALVCGPSGESPPVVDLDLAQAERLAAAALEEPNRHQAARLVAAAMERVGEDVPGLRNRGLLATHELVAGVPNRADWADAVAKGRSALSQRDHDLIRALGYQIEGSGKHQVLRTGEGNARAVAVFLQEDEQPDVPAYRYDLQTPVTYALTQADRENLPWVVSVRGRTLRLYSSTTSGAAGQRGRTETYVEVDLSLLPTDRAGYLHLLFSSEALKKGGTFYEVQQASRDFTAALSDRLRDRVYDEVVPRLAVEVARQVGGTSEEELDRHFRTALTILFRLLFVSYAEDSKLLPLHVNGAYTDASLKEMARRLSEDVNADRELGFDDPLTGRPAERQDEANDDLWARCQELFAAVDKGHSRWGVPAYNGGLFSSDSAVNPVGGTIDRLRLTNAAFGPALLSLVADRTPDGDVGPIDFRSLSVREFGTIYEGLLESELSVAEQDLTLDSEGTYLPAGEGDAVAVSAGNVYLHNASGQRKSSGAYFTKPFAVDHLLDRALEPTLEEHLDRVARHLAEGDEADAADSLFDFRVADISMGSGHFLTAVVDRIEARISGFLAEHPIPRVADELARLRDQAVEALGDASSHIEIETSSLLRRLIARRCVYGVDLNPVSVELARVSMWIHTFVPGLPLSFLNDSLVVGDSLTGVATLDEAVEELQISQGELFTSLLTDVLKRAEDPLSKLARLLDATPKDLAKARAAAADVREAVEPVAAFLDGITSKRAGGDPPPFVNDVEDLKDLVDDDRRSIARELGSLHFPVAFPEVFLRARPGFDVIVGNPPWEKVKVETHEFWGRHFPGFRGLPQREKEREAKRFERERPDLVEALREEQVAALRLAEIMKRGPYDLGSGDTELSRAFAWRFWHLLRKGGRMGVVLPRQATLASPGMNGWRDDVLRRGAFDDVCVLVNNREWIFDDVHPQYTIGLVTIRRGGEREGLRLHGPYRPLEDYHRGVQREGEVIGAQEFRRWGSDLVFPMLSAPSDVRIYRAMLRHPKVGDDRADFAFRPVREIESAHKHLFSHRKPSDEAWPVYTGASFNIWNPETGTYYAWVEPGFITRHLYEKRLRQIEHPRSAFYRLARSLAEDPSTLPVHAPRIAFRDVTRATDQRTLIAALIPPHVVPHEKAPYLLRYAGDEQDEAFLLGLLSSRVLDWFARRIVETGMKIGVFNSLPVPNKNGGPGARHIARLAGRLAAVDARYSDWATAVGTEWGTLEGPAMDQMLVELDASVARLYGLEEAEIRNLYATFHPTWDHEPWTERVLEHYRTLTWDPAEVPA